MEDVDVQLLHTWTHQQTPVNLVVQDVMLVLLMAVQHAVQGLIS